MKTGAAALACLMTVLTSVGFAGDEALSTSLRSLTDAERSFAKRCGEVGVRASFLEFFATDAIAFTPEPVRYTEAVKNLPSPANPLAVRLEWEPQTGDISASSDLGFTTGPSVRTNTTAPDSPKRYGRFLSVWRKQDDGTWKVAADIGVSTPAESAPLGTPFRKMRDDSSTEAAASDSALDPVELDRELSRLCTSRGFLAGYLSRSGEEVHLYRENHMPIVGTNALQVHLAKGVSVIRWSPVAGEISRAGDLCYTYGSYELKGGPKGETGYYLHVWRRGSEGRWKLVADATNPVVADEK